MYYLPVIVHKLSLVWCGPRAQPLLLIIICKPVPVRSRKLFTAARHLPMTSAVTAVEWNTSVSCLSRHQVVGRSFVTPLCHTSPECLCLMRCRGVEHWSVASFTFAWFYSDWRKRKKNRLLWKTTEEVHEEETAMSWKQRLVLKRLAWIVFSKLGGIFTLKEEQLTSLTTFIGGQHCLWTGFHKCSVINSA